MKRTSDDIVVKAFELRAEGLSYTDIGARMGFSPTTVYKWIKGERGDWKERYYGDPEYKARLLSRQNEWARQKRLNDPEYRKRRNAKHRERIRDWKQTLPGRVGIALMMSKCMARRKGHSPCSALKEALIAAWIQQDGRCKMCGIAEEECERRFHLDHDHETGEFRGWLCRGCNTALGLLGDNPGIAAQRLSNYAQAIESRRLSIAKCS